MGAEPKRNRGFLDRAERTRDFYLFTRAGPKRHRGLLDSPRTGAELNWSRSLRKWTRSVAPTSFTAEITLVFMSPAARCSLCSPLPTGVITDNSYQLCCEEQRDRLRSERSGLILGPSCKLCISNRPRNGPATIGPYPTQPRRTSQYFRTEPARFGSRVIGSRRNRATL